MCLPKIDEYDVDAKGSPALWKAQRAFLSAELLRGKLHLDCAANRYYYALLHLASHWFGYGKTHGELTAEYLRKIDDKAQKAISRAQSARNRADYKDVPVSVETICLVIAPVTEAMARGLDSAGIKRKTAE